MALKKNVAKKATKATKATKVISDKDLTTKKNAEDLLKDVKLTSVFNKKDEIEPITANTSKTITSETTESTSGKEWLKDELDRATIKIAELEENLGKSKSDYQKIFDLQKANSADGGEDIKHMRQGIALLYNDLVKNSQKYKDANIQVMLGRLTRMFPYLVKK